ncbi:MAG TPA: hypothetical protein V6D08_03825 [Candidatus Obscuribacterales bacterium]
MLRLVDKLTPEEQELLRVRLNSKSKTERWQALFDKVQEQCKGLPPISDEEIVSDLKDIRKELKAKRANQGSP